MSCWQILGLSPTGDVRAIKRAYAALLKRNRPEDDLQAFQQLRTAYDEALAAAPHVNAEGAQAQEIPLPDWLLPFADPTPAAQNHTEPAPASPLITAASEEASETHAPLAISVDPPSESPPEPDLRQRAQAECQEVWARCEQDEEDAPEPFGDYFARTLRSPAWQAPPAAQALQQALLESLDATVFNPAAISWSHAFVSRSLGATIAEQAGEHFGWFDPAARKHPQRRLLDDLWHTVLHENCRQIAARYDAQLPARANRDTLREALQAQLQRPLWQLLDHRQALASQWVSYLNESSFELPVYEAVSEAFGWDADPLALQVLAGATQLQEAVRQAKARGMLLRLATRSETHPEVPRRIAATLLHPRVSWVDRYRSTEERFDAQIRKAILVLEDEMPESLEAVAPFVLRFWKKERALYHDIWALPTMLGWISTTLYATQLAKQFGLQSYWLLLVILPAMAVGIVASYFATYGVASLRLAWKRRFYAAWRNFDNAHTPRIPRIGAALCARDIGLTRDLLPLAALYAFFLIALLLQGKENGLFIPLFFAMLPTGLIYLIWRSVLRLSAQ